MVGASPTKHHASRDAPVVSERSEDRVKEKPTEDPVISAKPVPKKSPARSKTVSSKRAAGSSESCKKAPYESPLKRVQRAVMQEGNKQTIESVDDLKAFIKAHDSDGLGVPPEKAATIAVRMRVAWTSFHSYQTGPVARVHLVDRQADDSVEEMHEGLRDPYVQRKRAIDSVTVTASLWGVLESSTRIPPDGALIYMHSVWHVRLFAQNACQLTTNLDAITVEKK